MAYVLIFEQSQIYKRCDFDTCGSGTGVSGFRIDYGLYARSEFSHIADELVGYGRVASDAALKIVVVGSKGPDLPVESRHHRCKPYRREFEYLLVELMQQIAGLLVKDNYRGPVSGRIGRSTLIIDVITKGELP